MSLIDRLNKAQLIHNEVILRSFVQYDDLQVSQRTGGADCDDEGCYFPPVVVGFAPPPSVSSPAMIHQHGSNPFASGSTFAVVVGLMAYSFEVKPCSIYGVLLSN